MDKDTVRYGEVRGLAGLFAASWEKHTALGFRSILDYSFSVRWAWDGDLYAFLLDPTVHPGYRRRVIGRELTRRLVSGAGSYGIHWVPTWTTSRI